MRYVAGILEKELISLSIKDIETIKEVPDIVKQDLTASITDARKTERFVTWLTAQRMPLNLIQRYEYQFACSAGRLWFYLSSMVLNFWRFSVNHSFNDILVHRWPELIYCSYCVDHSVLDFVDFINDETLMVCSI